MERHIEYMKRRLKEENYKGHTLHSFGDSFTYGYDLSDCPADSENFSKLTYSALFAEHYNMNYKCHAIGASANNGILRQIKLADIKQRDTCLVMWSFAVRYAFMFDGEAGWTSLEMDNPNHAWWWNHIDQEPEQCLDRSIDSILTAQAILDSIGCNYTFLCNNIELQDEIQYNKQILNYNSKWVDKSKWLFLPQNHEMINSKEKHPFDNIHKDVFNILKETI